MGFNDEELASTIFEISHNCKKFDEMEDKVRSSSLNSFEFTSDFIFDLWGVIDDWRCNRLCNETCNNEKMKNHNFFDTKYNETDKDKQSSSSKVEASKKISEDFLITNDELNLISKESHSINEEDDNLPLPPPPLYEEKIV